MGVNEWTQLGVAALSGSFLPSTTRYLWRRLRNDPVAAAEARKANIEADGLILKHMKDEIDRLGRELAEVRRQQADERAACDKQILAMAGRIRQLEQHHVSLGHFGKNIAEAPLHVAYPTLDENKDEDLLARLNAIPGHGDLGGAPDGR